NVDRDEIFRTNVDGTATVLALADQLGVEAFHHVSTAYVAGHRSGVIGERMPDGQRDTNNLYELSKIEAELLVGAAAGRFAVNVFRPSIVVGHGGTRAATTFTGLYGFTRQLVRMSRTSRSQLSGWLSRKPVKILAEPDTPLNLIPVDLVARQAVALARAGCSGRVAHLSNATPTTVGAAIGTIFDRLDLHPPTYVDSRDEFNVIDSEFHREMNFYNSYLSGEKWFEQSTAREFGLAPLAYDFSPPVLRSFYDWYLDRLFAPLGAGSEAAEAVGG
ncbi:MAG TPA: SDR family oxidoreductase, partial [Micromonospora sp.]